MLVHLSTILLILSSTSPISARRYAPKQNTHAVRDLATQSIPAVNNPNDQATIQDNVELGVCVQLDTEIVTSGVAIEENICICVDAASSSSIQGSGLDISVDTSSELQIATNGGLYAEEQVAANILGDVLVNAYLGSVVTICIQAELSVDVNGQSHHNWTNIDQYGCCFRTCNPGYIPNPNGPGCIPGCANGEQLCNGQCYNPNKDTCTSGVITRKHNHKRSIDCPTGFSTCSIGIKSEGAFECVDTQTDIESCGGCINPLYQVAPYGQDCTAIPNTDVVSCNSGLCQIESCMRGYKLSENSTSCEQIPHASIFDQVKAGGRLLNIMG